MYNWKQTKLNKLYIWDLERERGGAKSLPHSEKAKNLWVSAIMEGILLKKTKRKKEWKNIRTRTLPNCGLFGQNQQIETTNCGLFGQNQQIWNLKSTYRLNNSELTLDHIFYGGKID